MTYDEINAKLAEQYTILQKHFRNNNQVGIRQCRATIKNLKRKMEDILCGNMN